MSQQKRIIIELNGDLDYVDKLLEQASTDNNITLIHVAVHDNVHQLSLVEAWRKASTLMAEYIKKKGI
jgi:hypothetical protein